jgi:hypothetical protein
MKRFKKNRKVAALRVGIALLTGSSLLANGQAIAADPHGSNSSAQDTVILRDGLEYPNPQYPNHKPLRGDYPGSYTGAQQADSDFDWLAAGAGATGMLGLILLLAAGRSAARIARNRRHRIPFVVDVRDDTPATG